MNNDIIIPAKQVWEEQKNKGCFEGACLLVMKAIKKASYEGKRQCLFDPRPTDLYESVKKAFLEKGYHFAPIGVWAGVRQDGEYICW